MLKFMNYINETERLTLIYPEEYLRQDRLNIYRYNKNINLI